MCKTFTPLSFECSNKNFKKRYIGVWRVIVEDSGRKIIQELNKLINYYEKNSKDKSMKDRIAKLRNSI